MVMAQKEFNLAGPVKVLSQGEYPAEYPGVFLTPAQTRRMFDERGWANVAALQLRNPMHRSHEYLAKIAVEVCDGVLIHSLIGNLKAGDIPANVRVKAIDILINGYFVKNNVINAGYPLDMRYAGPREALLHATFRQNYGVNNMHFIGGAGQITVSALGQLLAVFLPDGLWQGVFRFQPGKGFYAFFSYYEWINFC